MKVRSLNPVDLRQIASLHTGLSRYCAELSYPEDFRKYGEFPSDGHVLFEEIAGGPAYKIKTFVAEDIEENLVGYITGVVIDGDAQVGLYGVVTHFFVKDQPRSLGVGANLLVALERWFKSRYCRTIKRDVSVVRDKQVEKFEDLETHSVIYIMKDL